MSENKERILCAAIYYPNDIELVHGPYPYDTGYVICGWRHCQIIELYFSMTGNKTIGPGIIQGFLTSDNRFVTRKDAAKIAFEAGQTKEKLDGLLSEDLY